MNINRINVGNNFGANAIGELKNEILKKAESINKQSYKGKTDFYTKIDEIKYLLPNATVEIDKNIPSMYYIRVPNFDIYAERKNDKKSYDYPALIKALTYLKENCRFDMPMQDDSMAGKF